MEKKTALRALTDAEVHALLDAAQREEAAPWEFAMYAIAIRSGLRMRELRALRWSDISFAGRCLWVRPSDRKAGEGRSVPFFADMLSVLKRWRKTRPYLDRAPVFDLPTKPERNFYRTLKAAGIRREMEDGKFTFRCLRHTFGSRLMEKGVAIGTLGCWMGHNPSTIAMRYLS